MSKKWPISLEEFMELSLDIMCKIDKTGKFTSISKASKKIWGYNPDELEQKLFLDFVSPEDLEATTDIYQKILKGDNLTSFQNHYRHKKGHLIPMVWSVKYDKQQEIIYCVAKETIPPKDYEKEKILKTSQAIINGTQNLIWSIDRNYILLACNEAMKKRFLRDLKFDLKVGQNMLEIPILTEEYVNKWKKLYDQCLKGEKINIEISPSGNKVLKPVWIQANLTPMYENNEIVGLVCHSSDITDKKTIESELKKNSELVESILEHIPMGVAVNEISSGKQLLMNSEFSKAYGWPESDLNDVKTFFEKVYPDPTYRKEIRQIVMADMESEDMSRMQWNEISITTKKGDTKFIDAKNIPLIDLDLMISTVLDVTEKVKNKKGVERALAEKKNILESISDAFYALDEQFRFTYVNESALKTMGKTQKNLIGKYLFSEFPELEKSVFKDYLLEVQQTGKPAQFEFYYQYFDLWFDENIYPSQDGFSVYYKDITDRKIISQALEEAYEKENEILDSISDAFLAVDEENNFTYLNKKAENLLNIKKEHALGQNIWDIFDHAIEDNVKKNLADAKKNKTSIVFDYFNEPLKTWFNIRSYPSKNGLSIYFRDITFEKHQQKELEKLNADLQDYTKKLETSNKELEQFAYIASHDLQEPLRMVSSFMAMLKNKYEVELDEKAHSYIDFAVDGAHRMRQIIIDLLEFSRAGNHQESIEKLNLNVEIDEVLSLLHSSINNKNVNLEIAELPDVYYSKTAIRQLFRNLIGNSIKYSNKDNNPIIEVNWTENKSEFQFEITDNGIGIDEIYHEKIFQIFQRLHSKSEYEGTGLGLAICKKIVERYRGNIWVESQLGKGSSFFFTLPKNIDYA
ncbi:PAS domain S-box protein [Marivirga sp.]|uniref:PAS domain-containing sensor histidine kinase n=1 Tax=Marivirga sp. TaxID=2018662 RepID=UPI002D7F11D1|nr:PAS domain S-box protein [Marivirga sp.]HET8858361.1 PAS domain S-box protein [Marivirga sp.]